MNFAIFEKAVKAAENYSSAEQFVEKYGDNFRLHGMNSEAAAEKAAHFCYNFSRGLEINGIIQITEPYGQKIFEQLPVSASTLNSWRLGLRKPPEYVLELLAYSALTLWIEDSNGEYREAEKKPYWMRTKQAGTVA